jgi:hypothetical protein
MALEVGVSGQDDLLHHACPHPFHELFQLEVFRADAVHGRKHPMEHMIQSPVAAGTFQRQNIEWLLHHADDAVIPFLAGTDDAGV